MDQIQSVDNSIPSGLISPPRQKADTKKSTKQRRSIILALLSNPGLTHKDIAKVAGTSIKTVARAAASIKIEGGIDLIEKERISYRTLIATRVPNGKAVDALVGQLDDVRFALPAIKYRDQILGLAPVADAQPDKQPQAMFSLPAGTSISVTVNSLSVTNPEPKKIEDGPLQVVVPSGIIIEKS